jgi:hypothetical protein
VTGSLEKVVVVSGDGMFCTCLFGNVITAEGSFRYNENNHRRIEFQSEFTKL